MAEAHITRRLAAILAADVVGYTRMMAGDEAGTLAALKRHREVVFEPALEQYNGRIVKLIGDGTLVEFASVVDAVNCALAIQRILAKEATAGPKITLRIGVNLGDVIIDGDDIYGDGVNVAARLEPLAEPGGICVASIVNESIGNRIDVTFENGGEIHLKNVDRPISIWKWHPKTGSGPVAAPNLKQSPTKTDKPTVPKEGYRFLGSVQPQSESNLAHSAKSRTLLPAYTRNFWLWAGFFLLFLVIFVGWWRPWKEGVELAGADRTLLSSHEKPSIAVLPFINMSDDRAQEYFSDGMTEDLITDLSRISGLFVIARYTTFTYKQRTKNVQQIARELGVSHVLTGSVQKADNRIRINAQLIDAKTKLQVWADRYDRELSDVFALQDEITQKIVSALSIRLRLSEKVRLSRSAKVIPEAYDMLLRGIDRYRRLTRPAIIESREFFERAIALDPKFARAYADLALTYASAGNLGLSDDPEASLRKSLKIANFALKLDETVPQVHFVLAANYRAQKQYDKAVAAARRAVALDPNYADGYFQIALNLNYAGKPHDALSAIKKAMRLNPRHSFFYTLVLGQSYYLLGRYENALKQFERAKIANPEFGQAHKFLAVTYMALGRTDDAEWEVEELKSLIPDISLKKEIFSAPFKDKRILDLYISRLRRAGLE